MFGFIMACVQLKLPFTFLRSLVVSTTKTGNREGWAYIDALPDDQVCSPPSTARLPVGLHYCKRYLLGNVSLRVLFLLYVLLTYSSNASNVFLCEPAAIIKWFFSKYRLKKNTIDCDKALLRPPPSNTTHFTYDYALKPPKANVEVKSLNDYVAERVKIDSKKQAKRELFMLCGLMNAVNEALRFHKIQKCGSDANVQETYSIHEDPSNW